MIRLAARCAAASVLMVVSTASLSGCAESDRPRDVTTFVALGHLHNLYPDCLDVLDELAILINLEAPDYVFLLGDVTFFSKPSEFEQLDEHLLSRLDAPYYIAPGNHDVLGGTDLFVERVGYDHMRIRDPNADFALVNSTESMAKFEAKLLAMLDEIAAEERDVPTVLLTHHRIWIDHGPLRKRIGYEHKLGSYKLMELIGERVQYMISGDAVRFFKTHRRRGIEFFQVGMWFRASGRHVYFTKGTVQRDGTLQMRPIVVELPDSHPWYTVSQDKEALRRMLGPNP